MRSLMMQFKFEENQILLERLLSVKGFSRKDGFEAFIHLRGFFVALVWK